ncbi:MAG: ComEC/Rec2 family competence protein, partial [Rhodothermales bacterium]
MATLGFGMAVAAAFYGRRRLVSPRPLLGTAAAGLVLFALGGARYTSEVDLPADHIGRHVYRTSEEATVLLEGRIADSPASTSGRVRFVLDVHRLTVPGDTSDVRGLVQVTLAQSQWKPEQVYPSLERGDVVRLRGTLRALPSPRNPADFDYGGYLQRRGIYALLSVYEASSIAVLGADRGPLGRIVVPVRRYAARCLDSLLPTERGRMVLSALVLGDRSRIDQGTRDAFVRTGLMHLLAVSGLHVLLVGMVLYALLRPLVLRLGISRQAMEIFRAAATMVVLGLYLLLTGGSAST